MGVSQLWSAYEATTGNTYYFLWVAGSVSGHRPGGKTGAGLKQRAAKTSLGLKGAFCFVPHHWKHQRSARENVSYPIRSSTQARSHLRLKLKGKKQETSCERERKTIMGFRGLLRPGYEELQGPSSDFSAGKKKGKRGGKLR